MSNSNFKYVNNESELPHSYKHDNENNNEMLQE